jgi:muramoyltetrapeptide carboxypeptidase
LEDLNESLYHIDRMMMNLKIRGKLKNLKGLIIGDMLDMKGSPGGFDKPAVDVVLDCVKEYKYPVLTGFPAGHTHPNLAFPLGREVVLDVTAAGSSIRFL